MIGPEMGELLIDHDHPPYSQIAELENVIESAMLEFLDSIDPQELEVQALSQLGGLEGEESVGACFLRVLKERISGT